jgi:hypothetical protein
MHKCFAELVNSAGMVYPAMEMQKNEVWIVGRPNADETKKLVK